MGNIFKKITEIKIGKYIIVFFFGVIYISLIVHRIETPEPFLATLINITSLLGTVAAFIGGVAALQAILIWQRQIKAPIRYQSLMKASQYISKLEMTFLSARFNKTLWDIEAKLQPQTEELSKEVNFSLQLNKLGRNKLNDKMPLLLRQIEALKISAEEIDFVFGITHENIMSEATEETQSLSIAKNIERYIHLCKDYLLDDQGKIKPDVYSKSNNNLFESFKEYKALLVRLEKQL